MNWINPKEKLPNQGDIVWVMCAHWKMEEGQSCEIYCGETCYSHCGKSCRVESNDYTGHGGLSWQLYCENGEYCRHHSHAIAWAHLKEISLPEWETWK